MFYCSKKQLSFICLSLSVLSLSAKKNRDFSISKKELSVANKIFSNSTEEISSEFKNILNDRNLTWGGDKAASKRLALTPLLKKYKNSLGKFWHGVSSAAAGQFNQREQRFVQELLKGSFDKAKKSHDAMARKMIAFKTTQEALWKKELSDLVRNVGHTLPTIVDLEISGVANRRKFVDSFVKNIETFFELYNGKFKSMIKAS
jgi:hypothetical protein